MKTGMRVCVSTHASRRIEKRLGTKDSHLLALKAWEKGRKTNDEETWRLFKRWADLPGKLLEVRVYDGFFFLFDIKHGREAVLVTAYWSQGHHVGPQKQIRSERTPLKFLASRGLLKGRHKKRKRSPKK
jgi:hypothetical protein